MVGLWFLIIYYSFFIFFTFWIFIDKQNIKIDISILSSNITINRHLFYILLGCFILFIKFSFVNFAYLDTLIFITIIIIIFIFLYFRISSINYFLFILPFILYFYAVFINFDNHFLYFIFYILSFCSIFIYNKILSYLIRN
ncbi:hypothetical protein F1B92_08170 [Campylobacter sp. FMV-PI01]|uniref:Uncharacterized protein n=1 Tax=Campylobacter portucalensis TaxID=2608384 RepID=A0A6L5WMU1_9BACT|nr:hypothetical protein [Campylobacter portucalensis]